MPRIVLEAKAAGALQNWSVFGSASAVASIQSTSSDLSGITASTLGSQSSFQSELASVKLPGIISGLTLRARLRRTSSNGASGSVRFHFVLNGTSHRVGTVSPTTTWTDYSFRVREDWSSGKRFNNADFDSLETKVEVLTAAGEGGFEVSRLWADFETIDSDLVYDSYSSQVPNLRPGDLKWSTTGTVAASIISDYLWIIDASATDFRRYSISTGIPSYLGPEYAFSCETRVKVAAAPGTGHLYYLCGLTNLSMSADLSIFKDSGSYYLALSGAGLDHSSLSSYLGVFPLPSTLVGEDHCYRLVVEGNWNALDPTKALVKVFIDYEPTPVITIPTAMLPPGAAPEVYFGTSLTGMVTVNIDFLNYEVFKPTGYIFPAWKELSCSPNQVLFSATHPEIVRLRPIPPLNLVIGQSNECCHLQVGDPAEACSITQNWTNLDIGATYSLWLDYATTAAPADPLRISLVLCSNQNYWDGVAWGTPQFFFPLPVSLTRTRMLILSGLTTPTVQTLKIIVERNPAAGGAFSAWLFAALLKKV